MGGGCIYSVCVCVCVCVWKCLEMTIYSFQNRKRTHAQKRYTQIQHTHKDNHVYSLCTADYNFKQQLSASTAHGLFLPPSHLFLLLPPSHPLTFSYSQIATCTRFVSLPPTLIHTAPICVHKRVHTLFHTHTHTHTPVGGRQVRECVDKWKLMRKKILFFFCNGGKIWLFKSDLAL